MSRLRSLLCLVLAALAIPARGQAPPPAPRQRHLPAHFWLAAAAGLAAGLAIGEAGVSYAAVAPGQRAVQRVRVGVTFGAIGAALGAGWAAAAAPYPPGENAPHSFWRDRWNTPLLAGIVTVQALDYTSTRYFRDRGLPEWLLTNSLVDNRAAFIATEAASVAAAIALAYVLHRTGHHRWERLFEAGYVGMGMVSAIANYRYPTVGHALF
ncbi:MAG TPA: hypothetical protein VE996_06605 [Terriglobales bacterium]|nr:hypothetical protein [Terriglobales bacterium]